MIIIRHIWKFLKGIGLLVMLSALMILVVSISCIASLFSGNGQASRPGKMRLGV
jgi:hypothetical protein